MTGQVPKGHCKYFCDVGVQMGFMGIQLNPETHVNHVIVMEKWAGKILVGRAGTFVII